MALSPSNEPAAEKAQQDPHCPWFLTGATALSAQSTEAGRSVLTSKLVLH